MNANTNMDIDMNTPHHPNHHHDNNQSYSHTNTNNNNNNTNNNNTNTSTNTNTNNNNNNDLTMTMMDAYHLMELPQLVLMVVLGSLSAPDVLQAGSVCRGLHALSQHNGVWKRVSKRRWMLPRPLSSSSSSLSSPLSSSPSLSSAHQGISKPARWRQYYAQRLALAREGSFRWLPGKPTGELPTKRYQHTGSAVGPVIYYIGGQELPEKRFNDIYTFNTESNEIKKVAPASGTPPRFARHSAVTIGTTVYLFGGFDGVSQHFHLAAYETQTNTWGVPDVVGMVPPSRTNHAAAAIDTRMYIFGGMYKDNTGANDKLVFLNDMFCLDTDTGAGSGSGSGSGGVGAGAAPLRWTKLVQRGDVPAARCGHRLLALGARLVLFGGGCGEQWDMKYSDVHVFNPATSTWARPKITGQAPVCTFTVAFVMGVFLFVFGGQSLHDNNLTNDLYVLDTVSMEWTKIVAQNQYPSPRDMASGNVVDNVMHMFGGYCGSAIDNFYMLQMDPALGGPPRAQMTLPPNA